MDKNYYEILQVNQNASPEIIEKAYKVLVKKYHPDLQEEKNKEQEEEQLKKINEAYEILSDPEKRKIYHQTLETNTSAETKQEETNSPQQESFWEDQLQQAKNKAYQDAYIQDLKRRGYKIRYQKTLKDYIKSFIAFSFSIIFLFLLWQIPFVKNYFINLYMENSIFHILVDFIIHLFHF